VTSTASQRPELTDLLLELLAMPCVTGEEAPLTDWFMQRFSGHEPVHRWGNSVVVGSFGSPKPQVLLVGHLDVVPPTDADRTPSRQTDAVLGEVLVGRGASDMKAGLAVATDCFEDPEVRAGPYEVLLVAYAGEEGPHEGNELGALLEALPPLRDTALAIVLEPTDLTVQLGCLGALHAEVTFQGRAAHSARPWHGENALTAAGAFLAELHDRAPVAVDVDDLTFREVFTATQAHTANARNVVPDTFTINLNYRFAPDKSLDEAERRLHELVGNRATVAVVDRAPAAPPSRADPLVGAFLERVAARVEPKQAWTDVARFAEHGVPALNYGPGLTAQAHQAGERVPVGNLEIARGALRRFLLAR